MPYLLILSAVNEATCTWSGQLPPRNYKNPVYSCKVFLGGVPWDITESEYQMFFSLLFLVYAVFCFQTWFSHFVAITFLLPEPFLYKVMFINLLVVQWVTASSLLLLRI